MTPGKLKRAIKRIGIGGLAAASAFAAFATDVQIAGKLGQKALMVVDGAPPKWMKPGQTIGTVKLLSLDGDKATVEVDGVRRTIRVGEAPVHVQGGPPSEGDERIVLTADQRGHYQHQGSIEGKSIRFMVDTGASVVVISDASARRMGLSVDRSRPVRVNTANGTALGYSVRFKQVQLGNVKMRNVEGVVIPRDMPYALLGNSFLKRFDMRQTAGQLTLQKRF